ncbi:DNA glycosylase AlkZ-like family protein [Kitasatospora sp. NBC_01539]|uniref:DNA glycosylase AlkZ-like family protein n=1 Tax=Kitasatospora sp. NBC_01539 TaxID=2903577 RepID=UPI0038601E85
MASGLMADSAIPAAKLRAWWAHRQWLDGGPEGPHAGASAAEVLAATGWARSVGGAAPYLGLFARAGLHRAEVDTAVAASEVHELPSARGCTYLLPASDFALGLAAGAGAPESEIASAGRHLGVTRDEIEKLCLAVTGLLTTETPLEPTAIREAAGGAVRALGDAGRKRGVSSTLPLALGLLQARGQVRRVPVNGRLDQQRYGYVRWDQPVKGSAAELAERYLAWAAPASVRHLRWFTGFTAATAKAALAPLDLVTLPGTELLLPAALVDEFEAFTAPTGPSYALVAGIDGIHLLHRDLPRLLDPADTGRTLPGGRAGRSFGSESDPQTHLVVDRGRIVGLWEYDTERREIVHHLYVPTDAALREALARTEEFVRGELGDARGFGLDSPKSRAPKIAAIRAAAGTP